MQLTLQAGRGYARMGDGEARTALDAGRKIRYCHETGRWPTRLGTTPVNLGVIAGGEAIWTRRSNTAQQRSNSTAAAPS